MSVGVLWVFYLQWHQLPSWVSLLYLPPPCYPPSFYPILQRTSEGETEGNTNVNKQKIPSPPPSRWNQVKEKKTLLCFLCRLGTSYSSVYLAPMTTSTTKKEVDINSRNLQISTVVDTWNKLKPRILYFPFVTLCHSSLYLECFKKNIICHILTSLMFILIHSSFTKSLMLFFSSPFIFAYYSILLIAFASPIFLLHLSSRDRVPYIYRFQNPPPPLFQVWPLWKSLCLLF